jgi:hypothetical protein
MGRLALAGVLMESVDSVGDAASTARRCAVAESIR